MQSNFDGQRTLDLNSPYDAREYLRIWDSEGLLQFEEPGETVDTIDDQMVIDLASQIFHQAYPKSGRFKQ